MTSIMNKVTCSLCRKKINEKKWDEHLLSTEHLQECASEKYGIAARFFGLIFNTCHNRCDIYNLIDEKIFEFWESYFARKQPRGKFNILCSDSINNSESHCISKIIVYMILEKHTLIHWIRQYFVEFVMLKYINHFFMII